MRLLTLCFRSLFRRRMRTALCIIGVILATTFVTAIGATTNRYTTVIEEMNVLFKGQVMVVSNHTIVIQAIPIAGGMLPQSLTKQIEENVQGAETAVPILFVTPISLGGVLEPVPINFTIGIPLENWQLVLGPTPLRNGGRFPTQESEIVVGNSLSDQYNWNPGSQIELNGNKLNVTGVLDTQFALLQRSIIMPLNTAQKIYNYPQSVNIITVVPSPGFSDTQLAENIKQKVNYVQALTEEKRNDIIEPVLTEINTMNIGVQTVVLIISLIFVMTVALMNVSERRRDFATLDAIGAPLSYTFKIVITETALIGVLGGLLGIGIGALTSVILASLYTNIPLTLFIGPNIFTVVPPLYMTEVFLTVVTICCLGGIIPALNASRARIAEVLRAEY